MENTCNCGKADCPICGAEKKCTCGIGDSANCPIHSKKEM